jgi:peptide chain release factor 1
LEQVVNTYETWKTAQEELVTVRQVLKESRQRSRVARDGGARGSRLGGKLDQLEMRLKFLLYTRDPNDDKNIMLEIRAGLAAMRQVSGRAI